jgi:membrane associated rhomboid family serine protease
MELRRLPVITLAIVVVCLLVQAWVGSREDAARSRAVEAAAKAATYWAAHSYLEARPPLDGIVLHAGTAPAAEGALDVQADVQAEQRELDALTAELRQAIGATPSHALGWVPASGASTRLLTYAFVHDGWWHLISNLWFLLLAGLALEDRWGRLPFLSFYLAAGVVAALAHALLAGDRSAALVGASGAVAGAMGAFLVLFARARVRLVALLGFRVWSFDAPSWAMLPLWLLVEVGGALLDRGSDTAHGAHVGGFLFGVVIAGGLRLAGIDRRLDMAVERAAVLEGDPRIEAALVLEKRGRSAEAVAMLEGLVTEKPHSVHAWEALRDVARRGGDEAVAARAEAKARALHEEMGHGA